MTPWPSVSRQPRAWRTNPDARGPDGARPNEADRLLSEIEVQVPASICDRDVMLAPATVAACEAASHAVATLDSSGAHLAGLGDLLVRSEAVASSKIERVYADLDDYARASLGSEASRSARAVVAAAQALRDLSAAAADGIDEATILRAHSALLGDEPVEGRSAGAYRDQQNWIGGSDLSPRGAVHVPPPPELVPDLMRDLVAFASRDDLAAMAQAAVVHAQFEAIHPFNDGNGRIGRALIGGVLRRRGVTRRVTVPIAAAMLADVDTYFARLADYREGDIDSLTTYVAETALAAAEASEVTAARLADLPDQWHARSGARRGSSAHRLVDALLAHPVVDSALAQQITGTVPIRTLEAIDRLVAAGVLEEITGRQRNRVWVAPDVMTELSDLEERIGRRRTPDPRWR